MLKDPDVIPFLWDLPHCTTAVKVLQHVVWSTCGIANYCGFFPPFKWKGSRIWVVLAFFFWSFFFLSLKQLSCSISTFWQMCYWEPSGFICRDEVFGGEFLENSLLLQDTSWMRNTGVCKMVRWQNILWIFTWMFFWVDQTQFHFEFGVGSTFYWDCRAPRISKMCGWTTDSVIFQCHLLTDCWIGWDVFGFHLE